MKLQAGEQLGPYQVLALIGAGGMGEVYRARDSRIGRDVAVKVLPCSATSDLMRRFEQEARAAGMLNHPNVLTVYDVGSHEGSPFIVCELLEGVSLREQLTMRLPARKAIEYAQQIARGLAAAHDKGIIHRDLKPENIFILDDGRVKLLDFGLVKLIQPEVTQDSETQQLVTDAGTVIGTAGYMSPEQVRGEVADNRSDIFSLGVVLFEMLTGTQPFRRDTAVETMNAILHDEPLMPADLPTGAARITQRMLEKHSSDRFQSVKDLAFALEAIDGSDASVVMPSRRRTPRTPMKSSPLHYERLTYRRGFIMTARFSHGPGDPDQICRFVAAALRVGAGLVRRADNHHILGDGRRRMEADLAGDEIHLLIVVQLQIDDAALAEPGDRHAGPGIEGDEPIAWRDVQDPIVPAIGPVREAATRELTRRGRAACALVLAVHPQQLAGCAVERHHGAPRPRRRIDHAFDHQRRRLELILGSRAQAVGLEPPRDLELVEVRAVDLIER